jgi:NAD(P)-dependent dehydrogenase (short-subunit alcohol dehydrogenase family)
MRGIIVDPQSDANLKGMSYELKGKTSLITGASRGIGAATALKLAKLGSDVVLNYRNKASRALDVITEIEKLGVAVIPAQADITNADEVATMFAEIHRRLGRLDFLILNASGGMEKDKPQEYAMMLNHDAQLELAKCAAAIMPPGGRIVFVTSHWAHFYYSKPIMPDYEAVAKSKRAGEDALRSYAVELSGKSISLVVVSGDLIEGTITPRLLQRQAKGLIEARRKEAGGLPTVDEFATAIVQAALDQSLPTGHTVFVGSTEYAIS